MLGAATLENPRADVNRPYVPRVGEVRAIYSHMAGVPSSPTYDIRKVGRAPNAK